MTTARLWRPIIFIGVLATFTLGFYVVMSRSAPTGETPYRLTGVLPQSSTLAGNASVRVAGLSVGRVVSVERARDGARVEMEIDRDHAPLPEDTRFNLRLRTLVGENYVELYPGRSSRALPDGGVVRRSASKPYVDVDEILEGLRGGTRERARQILRGLGAALDERGTDLNRTVGEATGFVREATPVVDVLHRRRNEVTRLADELGQVAAAVGQRGDAVRQFSRMARRTFTAVAARDEALRATLARLPSTIRQVRKTTGVVRAVSRQASPVLVNAGAAVRGLRPTIGRLPSAAREGNALMAELGRAAPRLEPTLKGLRALSGPTRKALPALRKALCEANPLINHLARYNRELAGVLQGMGSATNYYDATGHAARLSANLGEAEARMFDERSSDLLDLVTRHGLVSRHYNAGYNPIPGPGQAGEVAKGDQPTGPKDVEQRYPRIEAEC